MPRRSAARSPSTAVGTATARCWHTRAPAEPRPAHAFDRARGVHIAERSREDRRYSFGREDLFESEDERGAEDHDRNRRLYPRDRLRQALTVDLTSLDYPNDDRYSYQR